MQKAWIEKMMEKGLCSCDEEHMFDCRSSERDDLNVKSSSAVDVEQQAFDDVLNRILGEKVALSSQTDVQKHHSIERLRVLSVSFP